MFSVAEGIRPGRLGSALDPVGFRFLCFLCVKRYRGSARDEKDRRPMGEDREAYPQVKQAASPVIDGLGG